MKKYFLIGPIIIIGLFVFLPKILPAKNEVGVMENYQPANEERAMPANQAKPKIVFNQRVETPIFLYHHIRPFDRNLSKAELNLTVWQDIFEEQLNFFNRQSFHSIDLKELYDYFHQGKPLPPKPYILTFDDGYEDFYQVAWPILRKYQIKATVFVITDFVGQSGYLTWPQIEELAKSDLVEFGAHTLDHKCLTLPPPSLTFYRLSQEIFGPKTELEKRIGREVDFFCYPYGQYNDLILNLVKEVKYLGAVTTDSGAWQEADEIYKLKRLRLSNADTQYNFEFKLRGILSIHYFNSENNF